MSTMTNQTMLSASKPLLRVHARKFLEKPTQFLIENLRGEFRVIFDDGHEVDTDARFIIYSSSYWDIFREFPQTKLLAKHFLPTYLKNGHYRTDTHFLQGSACLFDAYRTVAPSDQEKDDFLDKIRRLTYLAINDIYNNHLDLTSKCMVSMSAVDILDMYLTPSIQSALNDNDSSQDGLIRALAQLKKAVLSDPELDKNPVAQAARGGLIKVDQLLQFFRRGMPTDIDSSVYAEPVMDGYFTGIRTIQGLATESRAAGKHLYFSTTPLRSSEYWGRRMHLVAAACKTMHRGDCGSKRFMEWYVDDEVRDENGTVVRKNGLATLSGKFFIKDDGTLDKITTERKDLIGKYVKLRSVLHCCHPDPTGICETCFGETSLGFCVEDNIGVNCGFAVSGPIAQLVLSTKHFDASAVVEGIKVPAGLLKYIHARGGFSYYLDKSNQKKQAKIVISKRDAPGLADLATVKHIENLSPFRISEFSSFRLRLTQGDMEESIPIMVESVKRKASFSTQFLQFLQKNSWSIENGDNYVIDLTGWDYEKPIMVVPMRHINLSDYQNEIAKLLEATTRDLKHRSQVMTPEKLLYDVYQLINERVSMSLAILEVVVYSSMVVDAIDDYNLPKPWTNSQLSVMRKVMGNRSAGVGFAFERHADMLTDPSFLTRVPPEHPYDCFINPQEWAEQNYEEYNRASRYAPNATLGRFGKIMH